jgi:hypothetical protein
VLSPPPVIVRAPFLPTSPAQDNCGQSSLVHMTLSLLYIVVCICVCICIYIHPNIYAYTYIKIYIVSNICSILVRKYIHTNRNTQNYILDPKNKDFIGCKPLVHCLDFLLYGTFDIGNT